MACVCVRVSRAPFGALQWRGPPFATHTRTHTHAHTTLSSPLCQPARLMKISVVLCRMPSACQSSFTTKKAVAPLAIDPSIVHPILSFFGM
mmetsp:Transcript_45197/g.127620  ORF Transcript_45197/g.127620 Transcript_45197/m.127620 type:complete len:91 (-) Transcript_45197:102-374(-)